MFLESINVNICMYMCIYIYIYIYIYIHTYTPVYTPVGQETLAHLDRVQCSWLLFSVLSLEGESGPNRFCERYLLGYMPEQSKLYLIDKELNVTVLAKPNAGLADMYRDMTMIYIYIYVIYCMYNYILCITNCICMYMYIYTY